MLLARRMRKFLCLGLFFHCIILFAQQKDSLSYHLHFTTTELLVGKTFDSNTNFPETNLHKTLFLNFGKTNRDTNQEWAYRLGYPKTGLSFALTDYGNGKELGYSVSVLPFTEFNLQKKRRRIKMLVGMGTAYYTKRYDSLPYIYNNYPEVVNRANRTRLNWSFRLFFYYKFLQTKNSNWRVGFGYFHQSNGHTKLPNQGMNSILLSLSREVNYTTETKKTPLLSKNNFLKSTYWFIRLRTGVGQNALAEYLNSRKPVYTISFSGGKVYNNTLRIGAGVYYRLYGGYHDYIKNDGELVVSEYSYMQENPLKYASSYGAFADAELLLGHVGFGISLGYNFYKPFYEVQWRLAEGFYWQTDSGNAIWIEGELNKMFKLKNQISSRLGMAYYLFNNNKAPKHNVFIGAYLNANLGQADFSELSIGYVYKFN